LHFSQGKKMNHNRKFALASYALLVLILGLVSTVALAQNYPNKPIRVILSFPPGGGTDFLARLVAEKLQERWTQPVVVDNRSGGNGTIGARAAAGSKPDGYTLYVAAYAHFIIAPNMYENLPYNPLKDFVPVAPVADQFFVLVIPSSMQIRTLKELVDLMKAESGKLNFASNGDGSVSHLGGLLLQTMTGTKMVHIPYKGGGDVMAALLGGQVSMTFSSVIASTSNIRARKLRALVVTSPRRAAQLPDVPTSQEAGLPELLINSWNGVVVPFGTPKEIVDQLNNEIRRFIALPEVTKRLSAVGAEPMSASPEEFSTMIREDIARWAKIFSQAGLVKGPL